MTATWASAGLPLGAAAPAPEARRRGRPPAARTPLGPPGHRTFIPPTRLTGTPVPPASPTPAGPPGLRVRFLAGCGSAGAARAVPRAPEGVGGGVAPEVLPPPWTLGPAGPRGWLCGGSRAPARGARPRHRRAVGGEARSAHRGLSRRPFRLPGPVSAPVRPLGPVSAPVRLPGPVSALARPPGPVSAPVRPPGPVPAPSAIGPDLAPTRQPPTVRPLSTRTCRDSRRCPACIVITSTPTPGPPSWAPTPGGPTERAVRCG